MLGVFAETNLRHERLEGIAAAKAGGVLKWRKAAMKAYDVRLYEGVGANQIAERLGIG
jgi:hypothetical protein